MAKKKAITTNAMRMLDKSKVSYELIEYDAGGEVGDNFGMKIAEICGFDPAASLKTLVMRGKNGIYVAAIPSRCEVDLKKVALLTGEKKVEMVHVRELLELTGYIRGGVTPIGMKKKYRTFIDASVKDMEKIAVSGGVCGAALRLSPTDLQKASDGEFADITTVFKEEN